MESQLNLDRQFAIQRHCFRDTVEEWKSEASFCAPQGTYACHLQGQNLANAVSALLHPEHGTLYRYISIHKPSADNSSSLGSKLISSNAPTYDFTSDNYWGVNTYLLYSASLGTGWRHLFTVSLTLHRAVLRQFLFCNVYYTVFLKFFYLTTL